VERYLLDQHYIMAMSFSRLGQSKMDNTRQ